MTQPTSLIQPYSATAIGGAEQLAKLEIDTERSPLVPGEYVYLLAHTPPGAYLVKPFRSTDSGSIQQLQNEHHQRLQVGLELNASTTSISLDYYPTGTPQVVFFGNEIQLDISKLRSGLIVPADPYDGSIIYKFNVLYDVEFHVLRYRPNHPVLTSRANEGVPFEEFQGVGNLSSWPFGIQIYWQ